ncbi:DUF6456 domain-containing protein [Roseibacterium sp. SDUM158016]|uniref:DUF6456 domain-containing protein n=1 Tax=Roseicyclus sediminis TaxID=2980997 RepID=UPI0021CFD9F4|nr:DUF6456 domain-containing protein [Roseibacterium sp. SDUM158016]MCU4651854.1 DUF6456 domain-containing protein [Roseibacterium sp. SDUM158016]
MTSTLPERCSGLSTHMPGWVPEAACQYLAHVAAGQPLRRIAALDGQAASTVCRRVRRIEARRDDPLIDEAFDALAALAVRAVGRANAQQESKDMTAPFRSPIVSDESTISREARRILRRLCETGAMLAVARDMEKSVVLRPGPAGEQTRTAVVDRTVAQAFAVKDWIACVKPGRIARYTITPAGKSALKRLLEEDRRRRSAIGMAEPAGLFQAQHATWGEAEISTGAGRREKVRVNLSECPLAAFARRKGPDGKPFLTPDLVQAGEKLREDFERAQMGPRTGQNWERFLTAGTDRGHFSSDAGLAEGPRAARERVSAALDDLGPGLSDIVLRVCCFLEGIESAERRLNWSARSGKVVLKIGLQRLLKHYEDRYGFVPALRE